MHCIVLLDVAYITIVSTLMKAWFFNCDAFSSTPDLEDAPLISPRKRPCGRR